MAFWQVGDSTNKQNLRVSRHHPMSWITIVWSINVGACLTLGAFYCAVWCKQRENWVHLLFSCSAVAAAAISAFELGMLNAQTVERYQALVRWIHLPTWVLTVSFVAFVRLYLHAGRPWLAWSICSLRTLVLIVNFIVTPNINFRRITSLRHFSWWDGDMISVPVGVANPWGLLSSVSLLLVLVFFVDATITVWRRGDRRRAFVVGGSMIFGAILAWHVPLVIWGVIDVPFFLCFAYSGIVAAMAAAAIAVTENNRCAQPSRCLHETTRYIAASVKHAAAFIDQTMVIQLMECPCLAAVGCRLFVAQ